MCSQRRFARTVMFLFAIAVALPAAIAFAPSSALASGYVMGGCRDGEIICVPADFGDCP